MSKVFGFPPHGHMPVFPETEWFAGRIELFGGGLVALGLFARAAAVIVSWARWRLPISSATRRAAFFR